MLLILNLPLVGLFVSLLRLPQRLLATMILLLCIIGAFSVNNSPLDLWVLAVAGIAGYVFRKVGIDPSPLVVALVLGPLLERMLRQTLFLTRGDLTAILDRPITVTLLLIGVAALVAPALAAGARRARRLAQARAS
jgi:putative tricarboxylic transport membrane protein